MKRMRPPLAFFISAIVCVGAAIAAVWVGLSALTTASLRFGQCGPSSLAAAEAYCQAGARLLYVAYGLGALALVTGVLALWIRRRASRPGLRA